MLLKLDYAQQQALRRQGARRYEHSAGRFGRFLEFITGDELILIIDFMAASKASLEVWTGLEQGAVVHHEQISARLLRGARRRAKMTVADLIKSWERPFTGGAG